MASTAAFNALLKLIEEPPGPRLFAMATTDPQKVMPDDPVAGPAARPAARVGAEDVAGNVRKLCELEGYTIDAGRSRRSSGPGTARCATPSRCSSRCSSFAGTEVTADAVAQVLGTPPPSGSSRRSTSRAARPRGLLALVQGLLDEGHDLRRFTLDLLQHLRDLLVLQVAPDRPDLVDATDDRRRRLQAQTATLPRDAAARGRPARRDRAEQRQGPPRLPLELALAKLAVPGADGDVAELADRVARLER
jgi:DNA polymerase III subunit gamma/tau